MSENGNESLQGQADVTPDPGGSATLRDAAGAPGDQAGAPEVQTGASENQGGAPGEKNGASRDHTGASVNQPGVLENQTGDSESQAGVPENQAGAPTNDGVETADTVDAVAATSQARIDANRANAQHSTGPRTPEGKARVARNAVKHGLLSRQAVLPTDDRAEFDEFHAAMWLDLKAVGAREEMLAERIVAQYWRLRRAVRVEACLFDRDAGRSLYFERTMNLRDVRPVGEPVHPAALGEAIRETMGAKHNPYEALRRYERTIQRDLDSCGKQLEELQRTRRDRADRDGPAQMPILSDDSAGAAAWAEPAACPSAPPESGEPVEPVGPARGEPIGSVASARGEPDEPFGYAPLGYSPLAPKPAWSEPLASEQNVSDPVGFVSQQGASEPVGADPVESVSQPTVVARDITGRRCE
jgi:hypothetical protein